MIPEALHEAPLAAIQANVALAPAAALPAPAPVAVAPAASTVYAEFLAAKEQQRLNSRNASGLPLVAEPVAAQNQTGIYTSIQTSFNQVDIDHYCNTHPTLTAEQKTTIKSRKTAFAAACKKCKNFVQKIQGRFKKGVISASARKEIAKEAKNNARAVGKLHTPGQSVLLTGSYGNPGTFTEKILELGKTGLSAYFQSIPQELREAGGLPPLFNDPAIRTAFENGNPDTRTLLRGVITLQDPNSTELTAKTAELNTLLESWKGSRALYYASFFSNRICRIHKLIEARVSLPQNPVAHAKQVLRQARTTLTALQDSNAGTKQIEEARANLTRAQETFRSKQALQTDAEIAFDRFETVAREVAAIGLAIFNREDADPFYFACTLVEKVATFFVKQVAKLGLIGLQSEERQPHHLLRILINEALMPLLQAVLVQLPGPTKDFWEKVLSPSNLESLCQTVLTPPTGDLHTKYIYRSTNAQGEKIYDVEIYATGPLLNQHPFKGQWPMQFTGVKQSQLTEEFFQGLIQNTLAAEISGPLYTPPFTSSSELAAQLITGALGKNCKQEGHLLTTKIPPTKEETAFYYSVTTHETSTADQDHPQVKLLLGQYELLKKLATERMQSRQINGTIIGITQFATVDEAFAVRQAAKEILQQAESLQATNSELTQRLPMLRSFYQEMCVAYEDVENRVAEKRLNRGANEPAPIHFPRWLSTPLRPVYSSLKAVGSDVQRVANLIPAPERWKNSAKDYLRDTFLHLSSEELNRICTELDATLSPDNKERSSFQKMTHLCLSVAEMVGFFFSKLYEGTLFCVSSLISTLPQATADRLNGLPLAIEAQIQASATLLSNQLIEKVVPLSVQQSLNEMRQQYHAQVEKAIKFVRPEQPVTFAIPEATRNGQHCATEFAGLHALAHFAPLNEIGVTVTNQSITRLNIPGVLTPFTVEERNGQLRACMNEQGREWMICAEQNDPRLSHLHSYLILEDAEGNKHVLIQNVPAQYQTLGAFAERYLGETAWNLLKSYIPQVEETPAFCCHFVEGRLTSNNPNALLYLITSHLLQKNDQAAYACFEDLQRIVTARPLRMPLKLLESLVPLMLCRSETASHIRLSLFAIAQQHIQQQAANPQEQMVQEGALSLEKQAFLSACILADVRMTEAEASLPHFPGRDALTAHLRQNIKANVITTLTPYVGQIRDVALPALHFCWRARENSLSFRVREKFVETLTTLITHIPLMIPKSAYNTVGYLNRFKILPCMAQLPQLMHQLSSAHLSIQEQALLTHFFTNTPPQLPNGTNRPKELSVTTLKSHFWQFYAMCWNESYDPDGMPSDMQVDLSLLQQEMGKDPVADVLIRLLAQVYHLGQTGEGRGRLAAYSPEKLSQTLGDKSKLIAQFNGLIETSLKMTQSKVFSVGAMGIGSIVGVANFGIQASAWGYTHQEEIWDALRATANASQSVEYAVTQAPADGWNYLRSRLKPT